MTEHGAGKPPATPSGKDGAGTGRGHRLLAAGLLLACIGGIGYFALRDPAGAPLGVDGDDPATRSDPRTTGDAPDAAPMTRQPLSARPIPAARDPNDLATYAVPGQPAPTMGEVIEGLHKAGIRTGLGAFNPPGTSPPLVGLAVPEDFVLPEGYVRHHQATDDGQAIEPILMYSPDYEFLDAAGTPVAIPVDRVVPASHAPAGLPIRQIRIPPPQPDPGSSS